MRLFMLPLLAVIAAPVFAQQGDRMLEPSSKWHLDYADEKCRMARVFGEDDGKTVFVFEQFAPEASFSWTVAGAAVEALRRTRDINVQFGPGFGVFQVSQKDRMTFGEFGESLAGNGYIAPGDIGIANAEVSTSNSANNPAAAAPRMTLDTAHGQKIDQLVLSQKGQPRTVLRLGNMAQPFKAMNDCADNLAHSWGLDPADLKNRVTRPQWLNQANLVRSIVNRYPAKALQMGSQAHFNLRIIVNADGSVADCALTGKTTAEGFRDMVCPLIKREGKFEPARDARGNGLKSFYTGTVRYQISS